MQRRSVITGIGTVTGFGVGVNALWEGLCAGRSAIGPIRALDASGLPCQVASEIPDFSAKDHVPKSYRKAVKVMVRDTEIAVAAAKCAAEDAGIITKGFLEASPQAVLTYPPERLGCHIGAGLICSDSNELSAAMVTAVGDSPSASELAETNGLTLQRWGTVGEGATGGMTNLQPLWLLKYLPNMLACHVTIIHGTEGPSNTITCAEASGLLSLGESIRVIERGDADVCFSGGCESKLSLMGLARLTLSGRLGTYGPDERTLRPYDPASTGTIPGEGGGLLIVEEASAAEHRGAKVYARVAGFGASQSVTEPRAGEANRGLELAIRAALRDAGTTIDEIDAIVPQACGVAKVDAGEAATLKRVFGERLRTVPLIPVTPAIGDCSAGSASILVAVGALALKHQQLPAGSQPFHLFSDNLGACPASIPARLRSVLVCITAQGGQNAAVVLSAAAPD